ncbi:MAG: DUF99 family protein [Deltaproteobacteria bacterium]|nr:DUF99 family protein [Deltaproteobacteria bacterium]
MTRRRYSNVIGFDDAPFDRESREPVSIVGAVFAGPRFDGVLIGQVERDGTDAAAAIVGLLRRSRFAEHVRLILLQGITLAGFNVVDPFAVQIELGVPLLVVSRRRPDLAAVRETLLTHIDGGPEKWAVIERLGPMEPLGALFVQRVGLSMEEARETIERFALHGRMPEPIRAAHLIAGALTRGASRGAP